MSEEEWLGWELGQKLDISCEYIPKHSFLHSTRLVQMISGTLISTTPTI